MEKTEIIYNGSCPICSREVNGYARYAQAKALPLTFTDLTATDLNALGLTPDEAAKRLHVLHEGKLVAGVDAFAILWGEMPRFRWLAHLVALPVIHPIAVFVYDRILAPLLFRMHKRRQARAAS
jgi:predicted DCC family thiol-disulfide oxidoreductase YuxK